MEDHQFRFCVDTGAVAVYSGDDKTQIAFNTAKSNCKDVFNNKKPLRNLDGTVVACDVNLNIGGASLQGLNKSML